MFAIMLDRAMLFKNKNIHTNPHVYFTDQVMVPELGSEGVTITHSRFLIRCTVTHVGTKQAGHYTSWLRDPESTFLYHPDDNRELQLPSLPPEV